MSGAQAHFFVPPYCGASRWPAKEAINMGAFGPALFSDDVACDVRDEYRALIEDGVDDDDATRQILNSYADVLGEPDDGPVVWLALAVTQSKIGRLDAAVARHALAVISADEGMELWREQGPKAEASRRAALAQAREQITGPQPSRRKLRPPWRHVSSLEAGDVLSYRTQNGRCLLLRVARIDTSRVGVAPILVLLDYARPKLPRAAKIDKIPDRAEPPRSYAALQQPWGIARFHVGVYKKSDPDYAEAGFIKVCTIRPRTTDAAIAAGMFMQWSQLGTHLDRWMMDEPL
jgi:hypothetical protein